MTNNVGFIGLGAMGGPMALNLLTKGFSLVVHDIDPAKVERLVARGAKKAESAEAVAAAAGRTIVIVETTAQVESVIGELVHLAVAALDRARIDDDAREVLRGLAAAATDRVV